MPIWLLVGAMALALALGAPGTALSQKWASPPLRGAEFEVVARVWVTQWRDLAPAPTGR